MFPTRRITTSGGDKFRDEFSLAFDGTTEYVDCGDGLGNTLGNNYAGDLTVSMWFKANATTGVGLFQSGNESHNNREFYLRINSNEIIFGLNHTSWTRSVAFTDTGNWHNVVAILDNGSESTSLLYLDGVSVGTTSGSFPSSSNLDFDDGDTHIGRLYNDYFNGNISDVVVYNKALSGSEVKTLYNGREPYNHKEGVCSSNLQAWWRMGDGALDDRNGLVADQTNATISNHLDDTFTSDTGWSGQKTITGGQLTKNDAGLVYRDDILTISAGDVIKFTVDTESISGTNLKAYVGGTQKSISSTGVSVIYINTAASNQFIGFNNGDGSVFNSLKIDKVGANAGTTENMDTDAFEGDTP